MLIELILLISVIAGFAAWHHSRQPKGEDPTYQQVRLQLQRHWAKGNLAGCLGACQELLAQDAGDLLALRYLGLLALREGNEAKALAYFNRGISQKKGEGEFYDYFLGQRMGCLFRERARLYVAQKRWAEAIKDAEQAKTMLILAGRDRELAEDVWSCAQYGAGNVTEAKEQYPGGSDWDDNTINALLVKHGNKLNGLSKTSRYQPVWHPASCPICK